MPINSPACRSRAVRVRSSRLGGDDSTGIEEDARCSQSVGNVCLKLALYSEYSFD